MKFRCPKHGELDYVYLDGYHFGDRLLETVPFKIEINDDKEYSAKVDEMWMVGFDMDYWLKEAVKCAEQHDFGECCVNGCDEDIYLQPWLEEEFNK